MQILLYHTTKSMEGEKDNVKRGGDNERKKASQEKWWQNDSEKCFENNMKTTTGPLGMAALFMYVCVCVPGHCTIWLLEINHFFEMIPSPTHYLPPTDLHHYRHHILSGNDVGLWSKMREIWLTERQQASARALCRGQCWEHISCRHTRNTRALTHTHTH